MHIRCLQTLGEKVETGFIFTALFLRNLLAKIRDNINRVEGNVYWELKDFCEALYNQENGKKI